MLDMLSARILVGRGLASEMVAHVEDRDRYVASAVLQHPGRRCKSCRARADDGDASLGASDPGPCHQNMTPKPTSPLPRTITRAAPWSAIPAWPENSR